MVSPPFTSIPFSGNRTAGGPPVCDTGTGVGVSPHQLVNPPSDELKVDIPPQLVYPGPIADSGMVVGSKLLGLYGNVRHAPVDVSQIPKPASAHSALVQQSACGTHGPPALHCLC